MAEEIREGQVSEQLGNLDKAIERLSEVIGRAESCLKPILREKENDERKSLDAPCLVSLADTIMAMTIRVNRQAKLLSDILERLEL